MSFGKLRERVALITGGGHGIGRQYCLRFAAEGAKVVVVDLDEAGAHAVAKEIGEEGGTAVSFCADVSDEDSIDGAVRSAVAALGSLDILVNNAAMFSVVPMSRVGFAEVSTDEWDRMMAINVKGTWLSCRAAVPHMLERGYGKIVNTGSSSVFIGTKTQIHYVTSKAAITGMTHNLARELGPHGITVNMIAPGSTLSEENPSTEELRYRQESVFLRAIPRVQQPADLAGTAVFLASSDSDFMTGQTVVVDGGVYLT